MAAKSRADELVVARGLVESRTKAQACIMAGEVFVRLPGKAEREVVRKAGQMLPVEAELELESLSARDVGRGAQKLRQALKVWSQIPVQGVWALDFGASTGGFTQVLLEHSARKVVALDVGTNQLHERLRSDPRVLSLEQHHVLRMDAATWQAAGVTPPFDLIVTDVSFISVTKVVAQVSAWLAPGASWIVLIKPQFEVGPKKAPGGIVRKPEFREEAILGVKSLVDQDSSLRWMDLIESPIEGGDGNKEFLAWIRKEKI
ncbi:MAG: TlyA family RNA methyltransferase [Bdellovibrionales bacterium]|nr:TlyA family RNA methyltransferase [Bdellovibrionales bacterium]